MKRVARGHNLETSIAQAKSQQTNYKYQYNTNLVMKQNNLTFFGNLKIMHMINSLIRRLL